MITAPVRRAAQHPAGPLHSMQCAPRDTPGAAGTGHMNDTVDGERISIEFSKDELEDLISHVRTGKRLRPGHPRQQRLLAKLRGFGALDAEEDENSVCPLERDTPDDVSWLADWVHGRLQELTDGDEQAVFWKQAHLSRFLLGRLHDWLEDSDFPTAAATAFQAEGLVSHIARYLEHATVCTDDGGEGAAEQPARRRGR